MSTPVSNQATTTLGIPSLSELHEPIHFRSALMPQDSAYPRHQHPRGQFFVAVCGVVEVQFDGGHAVLPPQYGIWLPPESAHSARNRRIARHNSIYVDRPLCTQMPAQVSVLLVAPLARDMMDYLRRQPADRMPAAQRTRFMQVLLDVLAQCERVGNYLPTSDDPAIRKVLSLLQQNPGSNCSVSALAAYAGTSERTLIRRCQNTLGMSLAEWRQRLRVVKAIALLSDDWAVENIAFELGYASASAFITMFRRVTGDTPAAYRRKTAL